MKTLVLLAFWFALAAFSFAALAHWILNFARTILN